MLGALAAIAGSAAVVSGTTGAEAVFRMQEGPQVPPSVTVSFEDDSVYHIGKHTVTFQLSPGGQVTGTGESRSVTRFQFDGSRKKEDEPAQQAVCDHVYVETWTWTGVESGSSPEVGQYRFDLEVPYVFQYKSENINGSLLEAYKKAYPLAGDPCRTEQPRTERPRKGSATVRYDQNPPYVYMSVGSGWQNTFNLAPVAQEEKECAKTTEAAGDPEKKVYSTPKDQESYVLNMAVTDGSSNMRAPLDRLGGSGSVLIAFTWQDRQKQRHVKCFQKSLSTVWGLRDEAIEEARQIGDWNIQRPVATELSLMVDVRRDVLDQIEKIVRDPQNSQESVDEKKGEKLLRGSLVDFSFQMFVSDSTSKEIMKTRPAKFTYEVRYPVVFVPGTAGSRLSAEGRQVWPQNISSGGYGLTGLWAPMRPDENGGGPPVTAFEVFRCYLDCAVASIYQGWLDHMKAKGYEDGKSLFLFPYDWRLDITKHPANLDKLVDKALDIAYNRNAKDSSEAGRPAYERLPEDKVVIVTHSQGGLVARAYTSDKKRAEKVAVMIQTAPTNYGSLKALKAAGMTGYSFETPFLDTQVGKWMARNYGAAYFQFPISPGGSGEIDQVLFDEQGKPISNTRAELSKLTTFMFCDHGIREFRVGVEIEPCAKATMNTQITGDAVNFHRNLPSPVALGVPTYVVAGTDQQTIVGYRRTSRQTKVSRNLLSQALGTDMPAGGFSGSIPDTALMKLGVLPPETIDQANYKIVKTEEITAVDTNYTVELPYYAEVYAPCGDNLVPLHRAVDLPGVEPIYVAGVTHGGMTEDATVQEMVDRLLHGVRPVNLPKPLCSSLPTGVSQGIGITAQSSPANLHVYDAQNRHTGLRANGTIELGIPGSTFEVRGDTQEAWLPSTDKEIRVTFEGLVDTNFNVRIVSGNGRTETQVDYLEIPETKSSRAEIKFNASNLGKSTSLTNDTNGDSKVDQTLQPSNVSTITGVSITPGATAIATSTPTSGSGAKKGGGCGKSTSGTVDFSWLLQGFMLIGLMLVVKVKGPRRRK